MRQRKPKNLEERVQAHSKLICGNPKGQKGSWITLAGSDAKLFLEVGTGKGQFICSKAAENPSCYYIGAEGQKSVLLRALEKAEQAALGNVIFIDEFLHDINEYFSVGELSGIYLNFSDPWPKDRHAKRRLTHGRYLDAYRNVLKKGGFLEFKTDNKDLFRFSIEELRSVQGWDVEIQTENLHEQGIETTLTEYESRFIRWNRDICFLRAITL